VHFVREMFKYRALCENQTNRAHLPACFCCLALNSENYIHREEEEKVTSRMLDRCLIVGFVMTKHQQATWV
jgi:hypothetical protein